MCSPPSGKAQNATVCVNSCRRFQRTPASSYNLFTRQHVTSLGWHSLFEAWVEQDYEVTLGDPRKTGTFLKMLSTRTKRIEHFLVWPPAGNPYFRVFSRNSWWQLKKTKKTAQMSTYGETAYPDTLKVFETTFPFEHRGEHSCTLLHGNRNLVVVSNHSHMLRIPPWVLQREKSLCMTLPWCCLKETPTGTTWDTCIPMPFWKAFTPKCSWNSSPKATARQAVEMVALQVHQISSQKLHTGGWNHLFITNTVSQISFIWIVRNNLDFPLPATKFAIIFWVSRVGSVTWL